MSETIPTAMESTNSCPMNESAPFPMGVAPGTPDTDPLEWNLLHPYLLYRNYNLRNLPNLLHHVFMDSVFISSISTEDLNTLLRATLSNDHRGDVRGLISILLEVARSIGGGVITMESVARAKGDPLFLATAQHLYDTPGTYQDGINSILGEFFSVVENYRDLATPWWEENSTLAGNYHAFWRNAVEAPLRADSKDYHDSMLAAARGEAGRRGISHVMTAPYILNSNNTRLVAPIIARHPLRGVTPRQIIELLSLAEEYNWEWALASFQWGVEESSEEGA